MSDDKLKARLRKLLELARRGVGGEADNAERFLQRMLQANGMTLEDIAEADQRRRPFDFKFEDRWERKILVQCIAATLDAREWSYDEKPRKGGGTYTVLLTNTQHLELQMLLEPVLRDFRKGIDTYVNAFIQRNALFPKTTDDSKPGAPMSPQELGELITMMRGIKKTVVPRAALTHGA